MLTHPVLCEATFVQSSFVKYDLFSQFLEAGCCRLNQFIVYMFMLYGMVQSYRNSFCGVVVLDSVNMALLAEDITSNQKYLNIWIFISTILCFKVKKKNI